MMSKPEEPHLPQKPPEDVQAANVRLQEVAQQRYLQRLESDPQLAGAAPVLDKLHWLHNNCHTCVEMLAGMCKVYAERTALRHSEDGGPKFTNITYAQMWQEVVAFASGLVAGRYAGKGDFVGVCGFASANWVVADMACLYLGAVTVPVPTNVTTDDLKQIINETELTSLVVSAAELGALAAIIHDCPTVRSFIVMDVRPGDELAVSNIAKVREVLPPSCRLTLMRDVIKAGSTALAPPMRVPGKDGEPENPLICLFFTSGSTGLPKGAEYLEKVWFEWWVSATDAKMAGRASIGLGFLPLNHIMGRMNLFNALISGGNVTFTRNADLSTLFEDMALVKPTYLVLVPRICNMLFDKFHSDLAKLPASGPEEAARNRKELIVKFREEEMGGRVYQAMTGSAPLAPEVAEFVREVLQVPLYDGLGSTEAGMVTFENEIQEGNVLEWKLVDCPELGYLTTDKPYPRGELLIKTKAMIRGYYKHPKASAELFDADGFLMTGDVMEKRGPKTVVWIDRRKNIMKLAQGEFVSVSRLEQTYTGNSPLIHQMYIYGSGYRSYLLAVVVPSKEVLSAGGPDKVKAAIRYDIDDLARKKALQGYEIPRDFIIEMEPFSKANSLLTDSSKPARGKLKAKYGPRMEEMYVELEQRQRDRIAALRQAAASSATTVADKVKQALEVVLGLSQEEIGDGKSSFAQLGGDSLAAIQFGREVEELTGVALPVSFYLDHSNSLAAIIAKVEAVLKGEDDAGITFEKIHGRDGKTINAVDLALAKFMDDETAAAAEAAEPAERLPAEPHAVLLTGANGFLGRFLLLDLLHRVSKHEDGLVVAIVRGTSHEQAAQRLRDGFDSGDKQLLRTFDTLSKDHLRVYAGDLAKPSLGLTPETYGELAGRLDTIVHNGALVNHAFSYQQLFEPNVLGTWEMMKLALTKRKKALTFISSVGVAGGVPHPQGDVTESEDGANLTKTHLGDGGYALGYGCSKWASEVQLRELHETYGVPVSIFRCGMILAHSRYLGQINPTDFFTRLLAGLVYTGVRPASFYADPNQPDAHFDGMPIDFVSGAIAGVASASRSGYGLYHVVNPHWDDGVSLDRIVAWVGTAGYPLKTIPDYGEWYCTFKAALERLDAKQQSASPLPIIYQWEHPTGMAGTKFDATQLRRRVRECTAWKDVPVLDQAFIHTNLRHMQALGIVGPPPSAGAAPVADGHGHTTA